MGSVCRSLGIAAKSNRVDIGVCAELPCSIFSDLIDELYESKIAYRATKFQDRVRAFCVNPHGVVVSESASGIVAVSGHSYKNPSCCTESTSFAPLVSSYFTEPLRDSNGYGENIARPSDMLGGGVIIQHFDGLMRGQRSTDSRIVESSVTSTLSTISGNLSLVIPECQMGDIIEMIYVLDKVAPGIANDSTLLYSVEIEFYNLEVKTDHSLGTGHRGLYVIGDCSGVTHSLSHTSASGVYVAKYLYNNKH